MNPFALFRTRFSGLDRRRLSLTALSGFGFVLLSVWSCHLNSSKMQELANFEKMYDKLSLYDSVVIVFSDKDGNLLDTVFSGKVERKEQIRRLIVNGWDGGKVEIRISGFNEGNLVYQEEKEFDGRTDRTDTTIVLVDPGVRLSSPESNLSMREGDTLFLPPITVTPANFFDKSLAWKVSDTALVFLGADFIRARAPGAIALTVSLSSDTSKSLTIQVTIKAEGGAAPVVRIREPFDLSFTRVSPIKVVWTVDGNLQDTMPLEPLREGPNILSRSVKDADGNLFSDSVTVFYDTLPPQKPLVQGPPTVADGRPTWIWSPGGGGGAGIFRFNLDSETFPDPESKDTTFTPSAPLSEGTHTVFAQERDSAGNWSASGSLSVRVDTTSPLIALNSHALPVTSSSVTMALAGQVTDSGSGVKSMSISGQVSGGSEVTVNGTAWTTSPLTLNPGKNTLHLTAADQAGNSRTLTVSISVNVAAPAVEITNPADSLTVTRLDTIRVFYTIDGVAGSRVFNLPGDSVYRLEISSAPNASGTAGKATVKVTRDATPPSAPTLAPNATPTNASAIWAWSSNGDSPGGGGLSAPNHYRYSLDNGSSWTETSTARHEIFGEGSYTLVVQERDRAGNWSVSSAPGSIVVDKTPPSVAITFPDPGFPNYVSNKSSLTVRYKVDGATAERDSTFGQNADTSKLCIVGAGDAAGNFGYDTVAAWSRPNVTFFTPLGAGRKDGSDWENAMSDLQMKSFIQPPVDQRGPDPKEMWLSTGNFIEIKESLINAIFRTGFNSAARPHNLSNRNLSGTRLEIGSGYDDGQVFQMDGGLTSGLNGYGLNVLLDNVTIRPLLGQDIPAAITFGNYRGSNLIANNVLIDSGSFSGNVIRTGGNLTLNGGYISNVSREGAVIDIVKLSPETDCAVRLNRPFKIGNMALPWIHVDSGCELEIQSGVEISCSPPDVVVDSSGTCSIVP